jgi:hypothetical protein
MKKICAVALASALLGLPSAPIALAADKCPPEVAEAKTLLGRAAAGKRTTARGQETQAPRQLAGGKQQDVQAPKQQEMQAPRGKQQDVQAPRGQDVQAPKQQETQAPRDKQQDVQAPRGQDVQAPRLGDARKLVREAEAACKKGDMALSAGKAKEAIELLK